MTVEVLEIEFDAIEEGDRLRAVDEEEVAKIVTSFRERGQITPIEVTIAPKKLGHYRLVAGAHRLAAARQLAAEGVPGWTMISATLFKGDPDEARLREIDENLYRHELTPYDQANFLAERRKIFERREGAVHRGRPQNSRKRATIFGRPDYYDETTKKFGLSRDVIERALHRHNKIKHEVWIKIQKTEIAKSGRDLDLLAKQEPADQVKIIQDAIACGSVRKVIQKQPRAPMNPAEVLGRVGTALRLIEKLSTAERKELWHLAQLRKLVPSGGNDED